MSTGGTTFRNPNSLRIKKLGFFFSPKCDLGITMGITNKDLDY